MEAGEQEIRKAFEDVTKRNVQAAISYTTTTRELVRTLEEKVAALQLQIASQNARFESFQHQLTHIQSAMYRGGSS